MARLVLLLFLFMMTSCGGAWFEENIYEDGQTVNNDDTSTSRRHLLLSVLINLDKLYHSSLRSSSSDVASDVPLTSSRFQYGDDDAPTLTDALEEPTDKGRPAKRARSDVSGVLPPFGELCRALRIGGCSHSRH